MPLCSTPAVVHETSRAENRETSEWLSDADTPIRVASRRCGSGREAGRDGLRVAAGTLVVLGPRTVACRKRAFHGLVSFLLA